jgi:ubiquinone/menaquinone biosynthesis C-methylase UbiE
MTQLPHPPHGAGKSSFDLIDPERLFAILNLQPGETVLDLGCGEGRYSLPLASRVGPEGTVYAADLWPEGLAALQAKAREAGLANLRTLLADVSQPLPLADGSLDLIFLATVLHDLAEVGQAPGALAESARLLRPGGRLAVVEFHKISGPPGPPLAIRLSPGEAAALLRPHGFKPGETTDLSPHLYVMIASAASRELLTKDQAK